MAVRNLSTKVILASLLHTVLLISESVSQTSSKTGLKKSAACLEECNAISATRFKIKEQRVFSKCYQLCLRRDEVVGPQKLTVKTWMERRTRRALPPNTGCPPSSPTQSSDWLPSKVDVCFGQYENTTKWYINVSWIPMNESNGVWNGTLVRLAMMDAIALRVTCFLHPMNQTFLSINISRYGYSYPNGILLKVLGFPYSEEDDISYIPSFFPALTTATVLPSSDPWPTTAYTTASSTPPNDTAVYVSTSIGVTNTPDPWPTTAYTTASSTPPNDTAVNVSTSIGVTNAPDPWPTIAYTTASSTPPNDIAVYVSISIGVVIGMVLVAVLVALLKHFVCHRKTILLPEEFDYDAFIIYNREDQLWVTEKLLPLLEERYSLKCCVHFRDFAPGKPFHETMAECVYKSYKIIAVLSNNFLKSNYCNYELNIAKYRLLDRRDDSLIMIRIDGVDSNKLPRQLRKRNFIDYYSLFERPFWEQKLLRFLNTENGDFPTESVASQPDFGHGNSNHSNDCGEAGKIGFSRPNSTNSNVTEVSVVTSTDDETAE